MKRILAAGLSVVMASFLVTLLLCIPEYITQDMYPFSLALFIAFVASLVALFVTFIWAIPMHFILSKYRLVNFGWYLLLAVIPSLFFVYVFKPFGNDPAGALASQAFICSIVGSIGALLFWYIAVRRSRITSGSNHGTAKSADP